MGAVQPGLNKLFGWFFLLHQNYEKDVQTCKKATVPYNCCMAIAGVEPESAQDGCL